MKNILITGANGQLGNEMRLLAEVNKEVVGISLLVSPLKIAKK